jgi:hypothetical protein
MEVMDPIGIAVLLLIMLFSGQPFFMMFALFIIGIITLILIVSLWNKLLLWVFSTPLWKIIVFPFERLAWLVLCAPFPWPPKKRRS